MYSLAIEFETSGGMVVWSPKGFSNILNYFQKAHFKNVFSKRTGHVCFIVSDQCTLLQLNLKHLKFKPAGETAHPLWHCMSKIVKCFVENNFKQICNYDCTKNFNIHHLQFIVCIRVDYLHPIVGVYVLFWWKVCFLMELKQNCKSEPGGWFRA